MSHSTGISDSYYRATEQELLDDYLKAMDSLTIDERNKLKKRIDSLEEKNEDEKYITKAKLQEKDEQIKLIQSQMNVLVKIISKLDSEEGKNKIAKQLIENGLCTK